MGATQLARILKEIEQRANAGCAEDAATWQRVLNVRALALRYDDDPDSWLRYASLCRRSGNARLSESVLPRQRRFAPQSFADPGADPSVWDNWPLHDDGGNRAEAPGGVVSIPRRALRGSFLNGHLETSISSTGVVRQPLANEPNRSRRG